MAGCDSWNWAELYNLESVVTSLSTVVGVVVVVPVSPRRATCWEDRRLKPGPPVHRSSLGNSGIIEAHSWRGSVGSREVLIFEEEFAEARGSRCCILPLVKGVVKLDQVSCGGIKSVVVCYAANWIRIWCHEIFLGTLSVFRIGFAHLGKPEFANLAIPD